jgi:hypothetical protein
MMRKTFRLPALLVLLSLSLSGCDMTLGNPFAPVKRPDYNNPVDPESRVPIADILPLIPDAQLRQAITDTGAVYNSDIYHFYLDAFTYNVLDLTGIQYLAAMEEFWIEHDTGNYDLSLAPLAGHARVRSLGLRGITENTVTSIPIIPTLRRLELDDVFENTFSLNSVPRLPLQELIVRDVDVFTIDGIGRFPGLLSLDISGTGLDAANGLQAEIETYLTELSSSLRSLKTKDVSPTGFVPTSYTWLSLFPNLDFYGIELGIPGNPLDSVLTQTIASYGPFNGIGFYQISSIAAGALSELAVAGISELEVDPSGNDFPANDIAILSLTRLHVSGAGVMVSPESLPTTIEDLTIMSTEIDETLLWAVASRLSNLRRFDLNESTTPVPISLYPFSDNAGTMGNLQELWLNNVFDIEPDKSLNGVPELAQLRRLRYVNLSGTGVGGINDLITNSFGRIFVEQ